ncbi:MAG: glycoside hydrolase family 2 protein [Anaerocolumna sp.]
MVLLNLNGAWKMKRTDGDCWIDAAVPGSVYHDLIQAGKLEDPFYGENEKKAFLVSNESYEYQKSFFVTSEILKWHRVELACEGLDTLAQIFLNGNIIGETNNMHRRYDFDIKDVIVEGENTIRIVFASPPKFLTVKNSETPLWNLSDALGGIGYLRKAHYMFGWDWGPQLPDMGIWRSISIEGCNAMRMEDVYITQHHERGRVQLKARVKFNEGPKNEVCLKIKIINPDGSKMERQVKLLSWEEEITFEIDNPQLWWPHGFGGQPLYEVIFELEENSRLLESKKLRIGLRTISISQKDDKWGKSFAIMVNEFEIFAMGANYIPEDNIIARCSREKTEKLIKACIDANFNTIRVWGGGYYPENYFYDLCDEYGLIVWQDLMFACSAYSMTEEFRENIRQEISQNMKRIRHHASLGIWCGNNEMEWAWDEWGIDSPERKADYLKQFEDLLPTIAGEVDPGTSYWLASPSSDGSFHKPNDENTGDMHDWSIWHGREPFTYFRKRFPRFMSEFGLQSFPSIKTVNSFTSPEDRNIFSPVMEHHQKNKGSNEKIMYYIAQYYRFPKNFEALLYLSQIVQAEGVKYGVEHFRRNRGRCMGAVYWQLNDCWPVASWSGIDSMGRWKALHYTAKRFFTPVLVSACEEETKVSLHVTNETLYPVKGRLVWKLCDRYSNIISENEIEMEAEALKSVKSIELDYSDLLDGEDKKRTHYLEYMLICAEGVISRGTVLFVPPKHFSFVSPEIETEVYERDKDFEILIGSKAYAKNVEISFKTQDFILSDNYFELSAGQKEAVTIEKKNLEKMITLSLLKNELQVRSLFDSYD